MPGKGLTREFTVMTAIRLIEENGIGRFSLRLLAKELGIKPASLYNHIENANDLYYEAGVYSLKILEETLRNAISGKERNEAVTALFYAYIDFAREHSNLYDFIMYIRSTGRVGTDDFVHSANVPIVSVLCEYNIDKSRLVHSHRLLRSILHGFIMQERSGFFKHSSESIEKSYETAINCFLNDLNEAEKNNREG